MRIIVVKDRSVIGIFDDDEREASDTFSYGKYLGYDNLVHRAEEPINVGEESVCPVRR